MEYCYIGGNSHTGTEEQSNSGGHPGVQPNHVQVARPGVPVEYCVVIHQDREVDQEGQAEEETNLRLAELSPQLKLSWLFYQLIHPGLIIIRSVVFKRL